MIIKIILAISLVLTLTHSFVTEVTTQQLTHIFGVGLSEMSSSWKPNREYFILFYTPEVQNSLDVRQALHQVQEEYQRKSIERLKMKGITQFEQFEQQMKKSLLIGEVDCGEYQQICSQFKITGFPSLLYMSKGGKKYLYQDWANAQQLFNFVMRPQNQKIDLRILKEHEISVSAIERISNFLKNETIIYLIVFIAAPFLFGYFAMSKNNKSDNSSASSKNTKNAKKQVNQSKKQQKVKKIN